MGPDSSGSDDIQRFEEHFRRNPNSLVFARLADACRKAGDPERALEILRDGIQRHPDYASAHIVRARALNDLERPSEAEASLRRVLELDAQNLVAMRGLAGLAERRGDPVEAVHWFEQIVTHDPANDEAAAALERLRKTLPETPPGLEPLPAPREEWWSSPAFEIVEEEPQQEIESTGRPPDEDTVEPRTETVAEVPPENAAEVPPESAPEVPPGAAPSEGRPASEGSRGGAWWFEDPAGDDAADDDGDLLTRTMAELYVKQGLVDEAAAIYRELLADRPEDEELHRALGELESNGGGEVAGVEERASSAAEVQQGPAESEEEEAETDPSSADAEASAADAEASETEASDDRTRADAPVRPSTAEGSGAMDPYTSHPVPASVAESEPFREWIGRLGE